MRALIVPSTRRAASPSLPAKSALRSPRSRTGTGTGPACDCGRSCDRRIAQATCVPISIREWLCRMTLSIPSMPRAPGNTRCSPHCCQRAPSKRIARADRAARAMRRRSGAPMPRSPRPPRGDRHRASSANISICSSASAAASLLPYASYYLTGFLNERPLSRLREDLAALGIERVENNFEPEDHAATLCEIMAGLADGRFAASPEAQRAFFEKHVAPWIGRLFADMERRGERQILPVGRSARPAVYGNRN